MQKEVICVIGSMWGGKTTALNGVIQCAKENGHKIGVFDHPCNNRNSSRDLTSLYSGTKKYCRESVLSQKIDIAVFDECHFFSVFGGINAEDEFIETINLLDAKTVVVAGLQFDCYKKFQQFPIWDKIMLEFNNVETRYCRAVNPCHKCGHWIKSYYSVNVDLEKGRIGDHYANCCLSCGLEYYNQWLKLGIV